MKNQYRICLVEDGSLKTSLLGVERVDVDSRILVLVSDPSECLVFESYSHGVDVIDLLMAMPHGSMVKFLSIEGRPPKNVNVYLQELDESNNPTALVHRIYHFI